ncbi:MAG TPA: E2/UBC family protein [Verrucomicrobiae bacterium]|nr:E2/UBC family protein [Verrucomicrobiae bacterium]
MIFLASHDEFLGRTPQCGKTKGNKMEVLKSESAATNGNANRPTAALSITVNSKKFTEAEGVDKHMTGRQIAALVCENPDATEVFELNPHHAPKPVPLEKQRAIHDGDEFRVIRNNVAGGFETDRISRELARLKEGGCRVEFVPQPFAAVIYRSVPTRQGYVHAAETDVLVAVPSGYPGAFIDGAFLPQGSPLLGRVAGSPQHIIQVEGRGWQLVSYHPHNGGGAAPWNKDKHGFHTYFDEILCWIHRANN